MARLTWQNVVAPNTAGVTDALRLASNSMNQGFGGLTEALGAFQQQRSDAASNAVIMDALRHTDANSLRDALSSGSLLNGTDPSMLNQNALNVLGQRTGTLLGHAQTEAQTDGTRMNTAATGYRLGRDRVTDAREDGEYAANANNRAVQRIRTSYDNLNTLEGLSADQAARQLEGQILAGGLSAGELPNYLREQVQKGIINPNEARALMSRFGVEGSLLPTSNPMQLGGFSATPARRRDLDRGADGRYRVTDDLLDRVIRQESGGDPNAVNPRTGASGLVQAMEATARDPGYNVRGMNWADRFNPNESRRFGGDYLSAMANEFDGDVARALVAYNWGPGNASKWDGRMESLPAETRNYVSSILGPDSVPAPSGRQMGFDSSVPRVGDNASAGMEGARSFEPSTREVDSVIQRALQGSDAPLSTPARLTRNRENMPAEGTRASNSEGGGDIRSAMIEQAFATTIPERLARNENAEGPATQESASERGIRNRQFMYDAVPPSTPAQEPSRAAQDAARVRETVGVNFDRTLADAGLMLTNNPMARGLAAARDYMFASPEQADANAAQRQNVSAARDWIRSDAAEQFIRANPEQRQAFNEDPVAAFNQYMASQGATPNTNQGESRPASTGDGEAAAPSSQTLAEQFRPALRDPSRKISDVVRSARTEYTDTSASNPLGRLPEIYQNLSKREGGMPADVTDVGNNIKKAMFSDDKDVTIADVSAAADRVQVALQAEGLPSEPAVVEALMRAVGGKSGSVKGIAKKAIDLGKETLKEGGGAYLMRRAEDRAALASDISKLEEDTKRFDADFDQRYKAASAGERRQLLRDRANLFDQAVLPLLERTRSLE